MEDSIAREGTLTRCNDEPAQAQDDIECANARRAAVAVALRQERARVQELERQSEIKLQALRRQIEEQERIVREARLAAERAERDAYEALWRDPAKRSAAEFENFVPPVDGRTPSEDDGLVR